MNTPILLQIAIMLFVAKIGGEVCERYLKQPAVLGEVVCGIVVGQSLIGCVHGDNAVLMQIAEIGAIFLMFEVGLQTDLDELFRVGGRALWVAFTGVGFSLLFSYLTIHALGQSPLQSIFVGGAMTATSVGITARLFADLGALNSKEARIVLGAAVADDVIGLIILAAISGMALTKVASPAALSKLIVMAALFLVGAILLGLRATPWLLHWARKMHTRAAVASIAIFFCLTLATLAEAVQLAPIIGAFAAGLILAKTKHKVHFEENVKSIASMFVPIYFVMMGAQMNLHSLAPASPTGRATILIGVALVVPAVLGKLFAGLTLPWRGIKRWVIGVGMIPRGEVALICASIGLNHKVIGDSQYAVIVLVVIVSTFITPPLLRLAIRPTQEDKSRALSEC